MWKVRLHISRLSISGSFFLTNRILARSIELFSVCDSHPWHDCGEKKSFQIKDIDFGADIAARSRES
jgi:hypothetical protein